MPWTHKDALRHTKKATTPAAQKQWARVANNALSRGLSDGDAIREANAAVKKRMSR